MGGGEGRRNREKKGGVTGGWKRARHVYRREGDRTATGCHCKNSVVILNDQWLLHAVALEHVGVKELSTFK